MMRSDVPDEDGNIGDDQKIKQSSGLGEVKADSGMPIDLNT